jgi:hypothetical protein
MSVSYGPSPRTRLSRAPSTMTVRTLVTNVGGCAPWHSVTSLPRLRKQTLQDSLGGGYSIAGNPCR